MFSWCLIYAFISWKGTLADYTYSYLTSVFSILPYWSRVTTMGIIWWTLVLKDVNWRLKEGHANKEICERAPCIFGKLTWKVKKKKDVKSQKYTGFKKMVTFTLYRTGRTWLGKTRYFKKWQQRQNDNSSLILVTFYLSRRRISNYKA